MRGVELGDGVAPKGAAGAAMLEPAPAGSQGRERIWGAVLAANFPNAD